MKGTVGLVLAAIVLAACSATDEQVGNVEGDLPATTTSVTVAQSEAAVITNGVSTTALPTVTDVDGGYVLFSPIGSTTTYLVTTGGDVAHTWESEYRPGQSAYLLEDGSLLRTGTIGSQTFDGGGIGGLVQIIAWDGTVTWEYTYADDEGHQHHDVAVLPNANVLMIAWEWISESDAIAMGRDSALVTTDGLWMDHVVEVDSTTDEIVWEWHVADHLVQDVDPTLDTFGTVSDHLERVDLNYSPGRVSADVTHINSIDYDPNTDQILLSVHNYSEIWVIDHDTTTTEAAGPAGDLVHRWGNPAAWGGDGEQILFSQHDAEWIADGLPGEGNVLIFNNGDRTRSWSSVEEVALSAGDEFSDAEVLWSWQADWFADHISGSQRLPDGSTLVTDGPAGTVYRIDSDGEVVWSYTNPYTSPRPGGEDPNEVFRFEWYTEAWVSSTG
ncbi:aryl-sulfate sulfotransferase [bacterium]|nr:aryl-sulfate sulfotransferase [bacterium]